MSKALQNINKHLDNWKLEFFKEHRNSIAFTVSEITEATRLELCEDLLEIVKLVEDLSWTDTSPNLEQSCKARLRAKMDQLNHKYTTWADPNE